MKQFILLTSLPLLLALAPSCSDGERSGSLAADPSAARTDGAGQSQGGSGGTAGSGDSGGGGVSTEDNVFRPEKRPFSDERMKGLKVKPGFAVSTFARGLGNARMMAVAPDGGVYVTRPDPGDVLLLRDADGDGTAEGQTTAFEGGEEFKHLHAIVLTEGGDGAYFATPTALYRAPVEEGGALGEPEIVADDLPDGGQHEKRTLRLVPQTGRLLLSIGSSCDLCAETNPEHAALVLVDPAAGAQTRADRSVFARGLRNTMGFDWYPGTTDELWGMDHGSDHHGDVLPPEELNALARGKDYGWPYVYSSGPGERDADPIMYDPPGTTKEQYAAGTEPATLTYEAHSAPIDFRFYTGEQFPEEYKNDAFVTMRGSWNRYPPVGYKLVRVRFDHETRQPVGFEDFVSGWLVEGGRAHFGRPAGLAQLPDGSLLASDDANGVIYRIAYEGIKLSKGASPGGGRGALSPRVGGALRGAPCYSHGGSLWPFFEKFLA